MSATPRPAPAPGPAAPEYDVVVVGLGPTGLVMSHLLSARGLTVLALEREPEFYGMARAVYTDDECLRILQRAGVADEVFADMLTDRPVRWVRPDGRVLATAHDRRRPHGWPASNFLYQPLFEGVLERRLAERASVTVRRGRVVLGVDDDEDRVTVTHAASTGTGYGLRDAEPVPGTTEQSTARYVVACDGGRSPIRESLGIGMDGQKFPQRWLVVDLSARPGTSPFGRVPHFDFICDPALPTVSCPQPGNRHRFEFLLTDADDPEEFAAEPSLRRMLARWVDPDDVVVDRKLVYTFNALVARQWRHGRILLAGDAAHMTPQFIGQGMNAGLRDADNLSWKLAEVIRHGADATLLDTYRSERAPHAAGMIGLSVFSKNVVSAAAPAVVRFRDTVLSVASRLPVTGTALRETWMKPGPRFRRGAYYGSPRRLRGLLGAEGALFPQPEVTSTDGRPVRLDDEVGGRWAVVGIGVDPREALAGDVTAVPEPARRDPAWIRVPAEAPELRRRGRRPAYRRGDVVVLRPDGYVFHQLRSGAQLTR